MASSVEALAEAFEGTLRELRRLRRHLKGASKPSSIVSSFLFGSIRGAGEGGTPLPLLTRGGYVLESKGGTPLPPPPAML